MPFPDLEMLNHKINTYVKPTFRNVNQTIHWNYISEKAYYRLQSNFVMPSYTFLENILNNTNLKVVVYNGNLDVVAPIAGASNWVHKLRWHGAANFSNAERTAIDGVRNGYYKEWDNLSFWWVFGAGHWVPEDNPEAMDHILRYLLSEEQKV